MKQSSFPKQVDSITSVASLSKRLMDAHDLVGLSDQMIESVGSPDECSQGSLVFLRPQPLEDLQKKVDACQASILIVNQAVTASSRKDLAGHGRSTVFVYQGASDSFSPRAHTHSAFISRGVTCCTPCSWRQHRRKQCG
jgi:hypothetical protein